MQSHRQPVEPVKFTVVKTELTCQSDNQRIFGCARAAVKLKQTSAVWLASRHRAYAKLKAREAKQWTILTQFHEDKVLVAALARGVVNDNGLANPGALQGDVLGDRHCPVQVAVPAGTATVSPSAAWFTAVATSGSPLLAACHVAALRQGPTMTDVSRTITSRRVIYVLRAIFFGQHCPCPVR